MTNPTLTAERCDECISVEDGFVGWCDICLTLRDLPSIQYVTPDEAELFAYRLLAAVKKARESE